MSSDILSFRQKIFRMALGNPDLPENLSEYLKFHQKFLDFHQKNTILLGKKYLRKLLYPITNKIAAPESAKKDRCSVP